MREKRVGRARPARRVPVPSRGNADGERVLAWVTLGAVAAVVWAVGPLFRLWWPGDLLRRLVWRARLAIAGRPAPARRP